MDNILVKTLDFLKERNPIFKTEGSLFTCPACQQLACTLCSDNTMYCENCATNFGTVIDLIKFKTGCTEEIAIKTICDVLKIENKKEIEPNIIFDMYIRNGWDLVPLVKSKKYPIEEDWPNKNHKDIIEWENWGKDGLNVGVKTGKISNITVIDVDQDPAPAEVVEFLKNSDTLMQKTNKGHHYFFKYDPDLPKTRIVDLKIDVETEGGQVVIFPSIIDGIKREFDNITSIKEIPSDFKKYLMSKIFVEKPIDKEVVQNGQILQREFENVQQKNRVLEEGNRHNYIMQVGGILMKSMSVEQVSNVLSLINRHFSKPPLETTEMNQIVKSLDKYEHSNEKESAGKVLKYLKMVEESTSRDIKEALSMRKDIVDACLSYLVKEGYIYRKRQTFYVTKKVEWKTAFMQEGKPIAFEMPYFNNTAVFRSGDMLVIGAKPKVGKTNIALNIVKKVVDQSITPYYVPLESGSRFINIATTLGLKEGQFKWYLHDNPQNIELEDDAVTIIDWLLPDDYASTDKLFKGFCGQLVKHGGILIVFVQLRPDGKFFADSMLSMFPAFVSRYMYDEEGKGDRGTFHVDYIREAKSNMKTHKIPCRYDWKEKTLNIVLDNEIPQPGDNDHVD